MFFLLIVWLYYQKFNKDIFIKVVNGKEVKVQIVFVFLIEFLKDEVIKIFVLEIGDD